MLKQSEASSSLTVNGMDGCLTFYNTTKQDLYNLAAMSADLFLFVLYPYNTRNSIVIKFLVNGNV